MGTANRGFGRSENSKQVWFPGAIGWLVVGADDWLIEWRGRGGCLKEEGAAVWREEVGCWWQGRCEFRWK